MLLTLNRGDLGKSLAVQWLGLHALTADGLDSIPGQGTKIPQAVQCRRKKKKKKFMVILLVFVGGIILIIKGFSL